MKNRIFLLLLIFFVSNISLYAQKKFDISGNFEINSQYYLPDSLISATEVPEKFLYNAYGNLIATYGNFNAGVRFETYQNALLGYDQRYNGSGVAYRYAEYADTFITVTLGNYYEQFGNGIVLRTYEDKNLGYDNSFDGIRVKLSPVKGIDLKALSGKQRFFWNKGDGVVRAIDGQMDLNTLLNRNSSVNLIVGGSFVSKYQEDDNPTYILPENVAAFAGRANLQIGKFNLSGEYAYKINDPSTDNGYIYKNGNALYLSASYSTKGFGVVLLANRYDNMSFRSDRNATSNNLMINSVPSIIRTHLYALQEIYPYTVQPTGEMGTSAEVFYKIPKKSLLGGKYGTMLSFNYSRIQSINKTPILDGTGYVSGFFELGDEVFFQEISASFKRKFTSKYNLALSYSNLIYNVDYIQGLVGHGIVYANIGVIENTFKFNMTNSLRTEIQMLFSEQDLGNFFMLFAEYSVAPHWFFSAYEQFNYNNTHINKDISYYDFAVSYIIDATRLSISYGRHREGIVCVGGVCRNVPASNGFNLTISTTF